MLPTGLIRLPRKHRDGNLEPTRPDWQEPSPTRLAPTDPRRAEIMAAHQAALSQGALTYIDPATGYQVMSALFLKERGWCCENGCRHCPYCD